MGIILKDVLSIIEINATDFEILKQSNYISTSSRMYKYYHELPDSSTLHRTTLYSMQ